MNEERLLLPFVDGVSVEAMDYALRFSKAAQLPLVTLALIPQPITGSIRAEHIQQANDFLETMEARAEMHRLSIERHECFSQDTARSILDALVQLRCQGIIFLFQDDNPCFLDLKEVKSVQQHADANVYLLHLPQKEQKSNYSHPLRRLRRHTFFKWLYALLLAVTKHTAT
jgi:hypothetical protein